MDGQLSRFNVFDLIRYQVTMRGILMESTQELRALVKAVDSLKIKPHIDKEFGFDQARQAYEYLKSQEHIGKVVIRVGG